MNETTMKALLKYRVKKDDSRIAVWVNVEEIGRAFFGLVRKVKPHYAESPLIPRGPYYVWFWQVRND